MTNSESPIIYPCHIEKSKHFHFVSFNQDQAHIGILYVMLPVAFSLAMCWISLNLCLPEGCLPNLSLCLCLFSKCFALSFIEQHRKYHVGGRNAMRYRNLYQSFTSSNWFPTELVENWMANIILSNICVFHSRFMVGRYSFYKTIFSQSIFRF